MPRSYRCIVIAAFGFLLSASPSPDRDSGHNSQPHNSQSDSQALREIAAAFKVANERQKPESGCRPSEENRDSSLCAEWKAADAAQESADWSGRAFWLGLAGLAVGVATLFAAGFAAFYAKAAATEGKRSADETKRSADAFISAERGRLIVSCNGATISQNGNSLVFNLQIVNYGRSACVIERIEWAGLGHRAFPGVDLKAVNRRRIGLAQVLDVGATYYSDTMYLESQFPYAGGCVIYRTHFSQLNRAFFLLRFHALESTDFTISGLTHHAEDCRNVDWPDDT